MAAQMKRIWILAALAAVTAAVVAVVLAMDGGGKTSTSRPAASPSASAPKSASPATAFPTAVISSNLDKAVKYCFAHPQSCFPSPSR